MDRRGFLRFLIAAPIVGPSLARAAIRAATTLAPETAHVWGEELTAWTRRAFIPKIIVQMRQATPLMAALLGQGSVDGGGPIRVPYDPKYDEEYDGEYDDEAAG